MAVLVTAPATYPVALAEIRLHGRAPSSAEEDDLLLAYAEAATHYVERVLDRALVTQTWRQDFAGFDDVMRLPLAPVQSATVVYSDADNLDQTLAATVWEIREDSRGPYVTLRPGQAWPTTYDRSDAVRITFVAGYGAAADVPGPLRQAVRLMAADWFENRSAGNAGEIHRGVDPMIEPYRRMTA